MITKATPRCRRCGGAGDIPVVVSRINDRIRTIDRKCPRCRGTGTN